MEYRGKEYQVEQVVGGSGHGRGGHQNENAGWKWWSIRIDPYSSASGTEANRAEAVEAAVQAIDRVLGPKISNEV
jgi:hypothetical protein